MKFLRLCLAVSGVLAAACAAYLVVVRFATPRMSPTSAEAVLDGIAGEIVDKALDKGVQGGTLENKSAKVICAKNCDAADARVTGMLESFPERVYKQLGGAGRKKAGWDGFKLLLPSEKLTDYCRDRARDWLAAKVSEERVGRMKEECLRNRVDTTNYLLEMEWEWKPGREKEFLSFTARLMKGQVLEVVASGDMPHPDYEARLTREREFMEQCAKYARVVLGVGLVAFAGLLGYFGFHRKKVLPDQVARIGQAIEERIFVKADQLLREALALEPGDGDLQSLRARLDNLVPKGDFKKAMWAWDRYCQLEGKLKMSKWLSKEEFQEAAGLGEFLHLDVVLDFAGRCREYLRRLEKDEAAKQLASRVDGLLAAGDIGGAKGAVEDLRRLGHDAGPAHGGDASGDRALIPAGQGERGLALSPANAAEAANDLAGKVEDQARQAQEALAAGQAALAQGEGKEAGDRLAEAVRLDRRLEKDAQDLLGRLKKARDCERLRLLPRGPGKTLWIIKDRGEPIRFFRLSKEPFDPKDPKRPDGPIPMKYDMVSRNKHLRFCVRGGALLAEDEGSASGTYYCGTGDDNRLHGPVEAENGALLYLGRGYKLTVLLARGAKLAAATRVAGADELAGRPAPALPARHGPLGGAFLEGERDDKDFVILRESVPVEVSKIGFVWKEGASSRLTLKDGAVFLEEPGGTQLLVPDETLECRGFRFEVKAA